MWQKDYFIEMIVNIPLFLAQCLYCAWGELLSPQSIPLAPAPSDSHKKEATQAGFGKGKDILAALHKQNFLSGNQCYRIFVERLHCKLIIRNVVYFEPRFFSLHLTFCLNEDEEVSQPSSGSGVIQH